MRPVFIQPEFNKDTGDCCITCLVMWTGQGYAAVIAEAPAGAHKAGMSNKEVIQAAWKLGVAFVAKRKFDIYKDDGILMLKPEPKRHPGERSLRPHHAVLLFNGVVLDPFNGRVWPDVEIYLQAEKYRTSVLLVEEG